MKLDEIKRSLRLTIAPAANTARWIRRRLPLAAGLLALVVGQWAAVDQGAHAALVQPADSSISSLGRRIAEDPGSIDSLAALMGANYLDSADDLVPGEPTHAHQTKQVTGDEISDTNTNSLDALKSTLAKSRRQAENQIKAADWWSRFAAKNPSVKARGQTAIKDSRVRGPGEATSVYKEQPLAQNAILTVRNQLMAIKGKHRLLMTKSVPQLVKLDQKLVDSYRACLKRKMPLYAGMLYRTRDFVVRMANEVKHERQVLEAMAKQTQRVLINKLAANRTLVKEYNHLTSIASTLPTTSHQQRAWSKQKDEATTDYAGAGARGKRSSGEQSVTQQTVSSSSLAGQVATLSIQQLQQSNKRDVLRSQSEEANGPVNVQQTMQNQQPLAHPAATISGGLQPPSVFKITDGADKVVASTTSITTGGATRNIQQRVKTKKLLSSDSNSLLARRQAPSYSADSNQIAGGADVDVHHQQLGQQLDRELVNAPIDELAGTTSSSTATETAAIASTSTLAGAHLGSTRRPKQRTYTVHINEVNLKRELVKTQALIDRINTSSTELMGVVDDIVYLFKLTTGDLSARRGLASSGKTNKFDKLHGSGGSSMLSDLSDNGIDQKRARKLLKSPFKVLFERYSKLTNQSPASLMAAASTTSDSQMMAASSTLTTKSTSNSESNNTITPASPISHNYLPDMKPLFEPASTYTDSVDLDLGFDMPVVIET